MPRRANAAGRRIVFESLGLGIAARAAHLERGFPGIGTGTRDAWRAGAPFTMRADDVWLALHVADPDEAARFVATFGRGERRDVTHSRLAGVRVLVDPTESAVALHTDPEATHLDDLEIP
jgi:hypothetical protein